MNIFFVLLAIAHILIWIFVIFAFLNKTTAKINLYYLIPIIYIAHIFPFHFIIKLKETIEPEDTTSKIKTIENCMGICYIFEWLKNLFINSFENPLSPQGLLIFGAITSAYKLKNKIIII